MWRTLGFLKIRQICLGPQSIANQLPHPLAEFFRPETDNPSAMDRILQGYGRRTRIELRPTLEPRGCAMDGSQVDLQGRFRRIWRQACGQAVKHASANRSRDGIAVSRLAFMQPAAPDEGRDHVALNLDGL